MLLYCYNSLCIEGNSIEIKLFLDKLTDNDGEVCFKNILPTFSDKMDDANNSTFTIDSVSFYTTYIPVRFFYKVSKLYPELTFNLAYIKEFSDICGHVIIKNSQYIKNVKDVIDSAIARDIYCDEYIDSILNADIDDQCYVELY